MPPPDILFLLLQCQPQAKEERNFTAASPPVYLSVSAPRTTFILWVGDGDLAGVCVLSRTRGKLNCSCFNARTTNARDATEPVRKYLLP